MSIRFKDEVNNDVFLEYRNDSDIADGQHVLIIPIYKKNLLLTKHKKRGIEFPGGKIEKGESSLQAAKRELYEETGGMTHEIHYIAQYYVSRNKLPSFYKDVYVVMIDNRWDTYHWFRC